ncbi:MAG TPA: hypothetical protein VIG33_03075 [Pseudobdellovibrionaceae bacterium]
MKKIISLIIFTAALFWTWNLVHSSAAIGFETHSGIQEKLAFLIKQTVMEKKPSSKDFKIKRLWTESLGETKVRAVFAYEFKESSEGGGDTTEQTVEGEAILFREPQDESKLDRWTLQSVRTTNDIITFNEGLVVTPGAEIPEIAPSEAPTTESEHQ